MSSVNFPRHARRIGRWHLAEFQMTGNSYFRPGRTMG